MGCMRMVPENWMLISRRKKLGLTQDEVAKKAGIKLEQYLRYEETGANISSSSMRIASAVLMALELDPTAFANGEYSLEPLPENDPLNQLQSEINREG